MTSPSRIITRAMLAVIVLALLSVGHWGVAAGIAFLWGVEESTRHGG
jgi:hypothetical protein